MNKAIELMNVSPECVREPFALIGWIGDSPVYAPTDDASPLLATLGMDHLFARLVLVDTAGTVISKHAVVGVQGTEPERRR